MCRVPTSLASRSGCAKGPVSPCRFGGGAQNPSADTVGLNVTSVDAARASAGARDEDDDPGDDRQTDHDPDPYLPGPTTAPLHTARVVHTGPPSLVFRGFCVLTPRQRSDVRATSNREGDEDHRVRGEPRRNRGRIPFLGSSHQRCSTADKGGSTPRLLAARQRFAHAVISRRDRRR